MRQINHLLFPLILLVLVPAAAQPLTTRYSSLTIDSRFQVDTLRIVNGRIFGRLCNRTEHYFDGLALHLRGVGLADRELWSETIDMEGFGPGQCRRFSSIGQSYREFGRLAARVAVFGESRIVEATNRNQPFYLANIRTDRNILAGEFCNRSGAGLADSFLNLFVTDHAGEVLLKSRFHVSALEERACMDIRTSAGLQGRARQRYLLSVEQMTPPVPFRRGEIRPGLRYEEIRMRGRRLSGRICNLSENHVREIMVRFHAVDADDEIAWSRSVYLGDIETRRCVSFSTQVIRSFIPESWRFEVNDWK